MGGGGYGAAIRVGVAFGVHIVAVDRQVESKLEVQSFVFGFWDAGGVVYL